MNERITTVPKYTAAYIMLHALWTGHGAWHPWAPTGPGDVHIEHVLARRLAPYCSSLPVAALA